MVLSKMPKKTTAKKSPSDSNESLGFEDALISIEKTVEALESGDLSLEDSLEHFEKGIQWVKHCQKELKAAEKRVEKLTGVSSDGEIRTESL